VLVLASLEGASNGWFPIALLVPVVVAVVAGFCMVPIGRRSPRYQPLLVVAAVAITGLSLHVAMITWRHNKDVTMCRSWGSRERVDQCIAGRRERSHGPWGIFQVDSGD